MWQIGDNFRVKIGGNYYVNVAKIIECEGKSIFTLKRHENGDLESGT